MRICSIAVLMFAATVGCEPEDEPKEERRSDLVAHWCHDISAGVPHRMSVMRDGTEVLTVGQYDHGRYLLLVRYEDEQEFQVINDEGMKVEFREVREGASRTDELPEFMGRDGVKWSKDMPDVN